MAIVHSDFPADRLQLRFEFLLGRARAHLSVWQNRDQQDDMMLPRACAATLLRDAACVLLLLDEPRRARSLLHESGQHFLGLGLPVGASFVALAREGSAQAELSAHDDLIAAMRQQRGPRGARKGEDRQRPMAEQARGEPRQLLAMMQADWLIQEQRGERSGLSHDQPLREALFRSGGHPAGTTGLSIDSYAYAAELFSGHVPAADHSTDRISSTIGTMMATRAEYLRAAQKDQHHWKLLARPAELVDLDATILLYLAMNRRGNLKDGLSGLLGRPRDDVILLNAPVQIASAIRQDQSSDSGGRTAH
jgi:hypothetical protein